MINTLIAELKKLTGLETVLNEPIPNENCIVLRFTEEEQDYIKTRARAEIYIVHELEEESNRIALQVKGLLLNIGDYNKVKGLKSCTIGSGNYTGFLYKDRYHNLKTYNLLYRTN